MSSPGLEMSLEKHIPVLIKETQMNSESGSQCGLTSLLPMSCSGRAAAFARDLHTRLRNLGAAPDGDGATAWLEREAAVSQRATTNTQRDVDTFYDFELECESPSSPVDELEPPFNDRSPSDDLEQPFYDVDCEPKQKDETKSPQSHEKIKNGFTFSTAFYYDGSPIRLQPVPRENGFNDKSLYSAITFDDCTRKVSTDDIDHIENGTIAETAFFDLSNNVSTNLDSDSEFESAKSEPSDGLNETLESKENAGDVAEYIESPSVSEAEIPLENNITPEEPKVLQNCVQNSTETSKDNSLHFEITNVVPDEKEESPIPEVVSTHLSVDYQLENDEDDRPQRVRRCSSLKTGKTPPGTPGRKKIVRFADVLGLDLADVKTFMDEIPVVPKSAYDDLTGCDVQNSPPVRAPPRLGTITLVPLFQLPRDFTDKLERSNVCLETARVCEGVHVTVCGSVRVRNLDFHKTVHIRYTMNRWKTFTDLQTIYVPGSCDGFSDRFQFTLYAPCISSGQRLELAVRFQCKGQQFWDNNNGANYCFDCLALGTTHPTAPSPGPLHPTVDWHPSFY